MKTVLILLDSLNRRHLKCYDPNARGITPNLDSLAKDGIVFDNHFIGSAPCMPARRDIFTGRTQFLERGWGGIEPFDITLPSVLRESNVFTHITTDHYHYFRIGGENYCDLFDSWDFHRGQEFDSMVSRINKPEVEDRYGKKSPQYELNKAHFATEADYSTPKTFQSACDWVKANKGCDDFFLFVECFDPHEPFDCPEEYLAMYDDNYKGKEFNWTTYAPVTEPDDAVRHLENTYLATLTMTDKWLGKFIQSLKDSGHYDDTMIILTTDHGHMLGEHGFTGKNYMHAYNELAHIPFLVHLPGGAKANTREKALSQNIDIMPTVLSHHGLPIPDRVKGRDLFDDKLPAREQVIYGWHGRAVNVYDGKHTYFRAPKNKDNEPCYHYCSIPTTLAEYYYFGEEHAENIEMGRFLPYTKYPVYRIKPPSDYRPKWGGELDYVMQSELYDVLQDYEQTKPITDTQLEQEMCRKLVNGMLEAQSPAEQFERLGLEVDSLV